MSTDAVKKHVGDSFEKCIFNGYIVCVATPHERWSSENCRTRFYLRDYE
jgi:hypothetical protein